MRKFSRRWVAHSLSHAQKVARVEAAKEVLTILQDSETNGFDGIATHHVILENVCPFSNRCHSEDAVGSWRNKTMITVLFTSKKLIAFDVLPRGLPFSSQSLRNTWPHSVD
jgi:hypothetical protein